MSFGDCIVRMKIGTRDIYKAVLAVLALVLILVRSVCSIRGSELPSTRSGESKRTTVGAAVRLRDAMRRIWIPIHVSLYSYISAFECRSSHVHYVSLVSLRF